MNGFVVNFFCFDEQMFNHEALFYKCILSLLQFSINLYYTSKFDLYQLQKRSLEIVRSDVCLNIYVILFRKTNLLNYVQIYKIIASALIEAFIP